MASTLTKLSSRIAIGILVCVLQPAWPAGEGHALAAALDAKDRARARQARQLYKEGEYEEAAKIYSDLSSDRPDMLVFTRNLGACYYYLRRPDPALSNLREYLDRARNVSPDDRREVERWIGEMERLRAETSEPAVVAPSPAPPAAPPREPQPASGPLPARGLPASPVEATALPSAAASQPAIAAQASVSETAASGLAASAASPGSSLRIAGLACGGLALASIGTGIYFYTRATSLSDKISSSDSPSVSDYKAGQNAETMQWVFYGVGAAALATGSVLYYLGWQRALAGSSPVAVAPLLGPGTAGLAAQGVF